MKCWLALLLALSGPEEQAEQAESNESPSEPRASDGEATELVLLHVEPDRPAIRARLQAELGLLGFVSERLELSDTGTVLGPDLLDRLASEQADAAIEIVLTPERINVWVADGTTGKTLHRRFDLIANPELADPRTLAISAVELLRASRLELEADVEPEVVTPIEPAVDHELPPDDEREVERARPLRGAISLVPLVTGSPGGFGPAAHVEIAGRWAPLGPRQRAPLGPRQRAPLGPRQRAPRERFALRFSLWVPTVSNRVERSQGSARLLYGMLFVEPQLRLPGGAPWFHPELGLGLGVAVSNIVGKADPPNRSNAAVLAGFVSHAHVGFGFAVAPRVWIRVDGYLGVLLPQPEVTFTGESVATWGLPWGTGSLGIELWF